MAGKIKHRIKAIWHRKKHSFFAKFERSIAEYIFELLGLLGWLILVTKSKGMDYLVILSITAMLFARAFPVLKKIFWDDAEKIDFLKRRRIEASTFMSDINKCLSEERNITPEKIKEIRQRILRSIVDTVRAYRNDRPGNKIFSNLLIPDGDDNLIVAIRVAANRSDGTKYKQEELLCSEVLRLKKPIYCGDAQRNTNRELPYKSFMAVPVLDYTKTECLAIITIDSTELHHFDDIYESFDTLLSPYITTITTTFILEEQMTSGGSNETTK